MRTNRGFGKRRWWTAAAIVLVGMGTGSFAYPAAEDAQNRAATETAAEPKAAADATAEAASERDEDPAGEVFLPTEEISEDYAAPFPVDI